MVIFKDLLNETNIWKIALYLTATMFISALVFDVVSLKLLIINKTVTGL